MPKKNYKPAWSPPGVLRCFEMLNLTLHRYSQVSIPEAKGRWYMKQPGVFKRCKAPFMSPPRFEMTDEEAATQAALLVRLAAVRVPGTIDVHDIWRDVEVRFGAGPGMLARHSDGYGVIAEDEVLVIGGNRSDVGTWVVEGNEHALVLGPPTKVIAYLYKVTWADRFERVAL